MRRSRRIGYLDRCGARPPSPTVRLGDRTSRSPPTPQAEGSTMDARRTRNRSTDRHRGGPGGLVRRIPPRQAGRAVHHSRCRRADRRPLAEALGLAPAVQPGAVRFAARDALSRRRPTTTRVAARWATTSRRMPRGSLCPSISGTRVDAVRPSDGPDGGFVVTAGERRFEAAQVIVATGAFNQPHVPEFAIDLDPSIDQLHSSDYRNPDQLRHGAVLVVGVSHSGADIAFEAARTHRTLLAGHATDSSRSRSSTLGGQGSSGR